MAIYWVQAGRCLGSTFALSDTTCRQLQLEENKVQTDEKFGFDAGEINSFSLAEAEATGADAIKAAVIIFKGTSDPFDTAWKSTDLKSRLSPTSKESLHFAPLSFFIFKVEHRT